jgi:hypothetical protein
LLVITNIKVRSILFVGVSVFAKYLIVIAWPVLTIYLIYYYIKTKK